MLDSPGTLLMNIDGPTAHAIQRSGEDTGYAYTDVWVYTHSYGPLSGPGIRQLQFMSNSVEWERWQLRDCCRSFLRAELLYYSPATDTIGDSVFYVETDGGSYISDYLNTYSYGKLSGLTSR